MELVIDKRNVFSLLSELSKSDYSLHEYNDIIKKGLNIVFNFDLSETSQKEQEQLGQWVKSLTLRKKSRRPLSIKWREQIEKKDKINTREIKSGFVKTLTSKQKRGIYLLDDAICKKSNIIEVIKDKGSILIGKVGEETKILDSINLEDTETTACEIRWENYCPSLPLTDIIICDNHFFKHKTRYEKNIDDLLRGLCKFPIKSSINCVIIIKTEEIDSYIKLDEIKNEIEKKLKEITGHECSVTIVQTYDTHDRSIITNYYRIKIGSTTQIDDSGTKGDVLVETKSNAVWNTEKITDDLLNQYQKIINTITNNKDNEKIIIGKRKCNFLSF